MPSRDTELEVAVGVLQAEVKHISQNQAEIRKEQQQIRDDIRDIRDTLTGAKGSWKTLVAIGSIIVGVIMTVGAKLLDLLPFFK